jgi:rubrerythrin
MDWESFFKEAMQEEIKAEARYRNAAAATDDPDLKQALEDLAYEEGLHQQILLKKQKEANMA